MTSSSPTWLDRVRNGEPFEMLDWDFLEAVFAAQAKLTAYNGTPLAEFEKRDRMLHDLFVRVGDKAIVQSPLHLDVGFNIEIGDRSFINSNCTLLDTYPIRIGKDVLIGPNCALYPAGHPVKAADRTFVNAACEHRSITSGAPVVIEDNVWIGGSVVIVEGVTIGARSMIGAGSVVTKSIPPDVLAAGNPCRFIRRLD